MGKELEKKVQEYELRAFMLNLIQELKTDLLEELKGLLKETQGPSLKKWIKSVDVKKLLNVSHGKLQTMRNSRVIAFTKIGGTIYYNVDDIQRMLEERRSKK